jgi:hypothetical protein
MDDANFSEARSSPPMVRASPSNPLPQLLLLSVPSSRADRDPQTVAKALRQHCNIPYESFLLAVHLGRGGFVYFSGPNSIPEEDIRKIFNREKFLKYQNSPSSRMSCHGPWRGSH